MHAIFFIYKRKLESIRLDKVWDYIAPFLGKFVSVIFCLIFSSPGPNMRPNLIVSISREWGFRFVQNKGPFKGQKGGNLDKSLKICSEPQARMYRYLAWNILRTRIFKVVQMISLGSQLDTVIKFYVGLYSKNILKYSIREPLAWMHWFLAWNILRTRRFKFVQLKPLGSEMPVL